MVDRLRTPTHVIVTPAATRLRASRLERSGTDTFHFTCGSCGVASAHAFSEIDHLLAGSLHAGLDGAPTTDRAAEAFVAARPIRPGERVLDAACAACAARWRLVATGGEQDRDGVLAYDLVDVVEHAPASPPRRPSRAARLVIALIALALGAGGAALLSTAVRIEDDRERLRASGLRAPARIIDETTRSRGTASVDVAFNAIDGSPREASIDVPVASSWRAGDTTIDVVYDLRDPELVVAADGGLRSPWAHAVGAATLLALAVALTWVLARSAHQVVHERGGRHRAG